VERIVEGKRSSTVVSAPLEVGPLNFRETYMRDFKRFAPQINAALDEFTKAGDGHSVWGMLYFLRGSGIEVESGKYVDLGRQAITGFETESMGADLADMHARMRALGHKTEITKNAEDAMHTLLSSARGYGDGWTIAHMLHNMHGFQDLMESVQILDGNGYNDSGFMGEALEKARADKDAGSVGWLHLRMRGLGNKTDITLRDKALFFREYQRVAEGVGKMQPQDEGFADAVKTLVGMNYLYRMWDKEAKPAEERKERLVRFASEKVKEGEMLVGFRETAHEERPALEVTVKRKARLFGFIPVDMRATVTYDLESGEWVMQKLPWWSFMAAKERTATAK